MTPDEEWATLRQQRLLIALRDLVDAFNRCDGNRGAFSCVEPHDSRCPISRASNKDEWNGEWVCLCGREQLDEALVNAEQLLEAKRG